MYELPEIMERCAAACVACEGDCAEMVLVMVCADEPPTAAIRACSRVYAELRAFRGTTEVMPREWYLSCARACRQAIAELHGVRDAATTIASCEQCALYLSFLATVRVPDKTSDTWLHKASKLGIDLIRKLNRRLLKLMSTRPINIAYASESPSSLRPLEGCR